MFMWEKIISLMIVFVSIVSLSAFAQPTLSTLNMTHGQSLDKIIAVVNDEIITKSELDHVITVEKQFMQHNVLQSDQKKFKKQVLDQLIYQKLQLQIAKINQIKVTKNETKIAIERIFKANYLSQAAFKQKLIHQGISYTEFFGQLQKQLIISKLQHQAFQDSILINKSDIANFQKQHVKQPITEIKYHIATVLIPIPTLATQAQINYAKNKAISVLKQLQKGSSFETVMRMYPGSADLNWRFVDELPQVFINPVLKMRLNELSGLIKSPNGFHIVKLIDKETKNIIDNKQIQQIIYRQKAEIALQKWLIQLRNAAYVHIYADDC